ncbi:IS1 family transposase [Photobacterium damselae]
MERHNLTFRTRLKRINSKTEIIRLSKSKNMHDRVIYIH